MDAHSPFSSIPVALDAIRKGKYVVVMDDENRENEGDLVMAAEHVTAEHIAFALKHTSGILCTPVTRSLAEKLKLHLMTDQNTDPNRTAFTVSIDHAGCTTGVSAVDRALTVTALASDQVKYDDFRRPGHVFPLIARDGGVLQRRGHTEVTLDLCRLAGLKPVGLLAEIMKPDGTMARLDDCVTFAKEHDLPLITVEQVANYRKSLQSGVEFLSECYLPIERQGKFLGKFRTQLFKDTHGHEHVVLSMGLEGEKAPKPDETILVRVHSECFTGNVLGSIKCDCNHQLDLALEIIAREKRGAVIYAGGHEGRGIGLASKLKAYALQDAPHNLDTFAANEALGLPRDSRQYDSAAAILKYLGINKINLLTNNKFKYAALLPLVSDVTPLDGKETEFNKDYLKVKKREQAIQQQSAQQQHSIIPAASHKQEEQKKSSTLPEHPEEAILKGRDGHVKSIPINLPTPKSLQGLRVGLVRTCWNETLVNSLADQTRDILIESGVTPSNIIESLVPGSFELPWAAAQLIDAGQIDVVVCFGVLVKGETMHFEYISGSVAQGLMQLQLQKNVPVLDAVLNCLTIEQADARCNTKSQLPLSLAATAIHMGALRRGLLPLYQPVGGSPVSIAAPVIKPSLQFVPQAETQIVLTPQPCGN